MTGWKSTTTNAQRIIVWNEENRVKSITDNGSGTEFVYDDAGERVIKRGGGNETVYLNRFYSIKNGDLGSKHIFAGETRICNLLTKPLRLCTRKVLRDAKWKSRFFPQHGEAKGKIDDGDFITEWSGAFLIGFKGWINWTHIKNDVKNVIIEKLQLKALLPGAPSATSYLHGPIRGNSGVGSASKGGGGGGGAGVDTNYNLISSPTTR